MAVVLFDGQLDGQEPSAQPVANAGGTSAPFTGQLDTPLPAVRPASTKDKLMRQLGLAARIPIEAASGGVGAIGDALNAAVNMAGKPFGMKPLQMPTQMLNRGMQQAGLPTPETPMEKGVNMVGGGMMGFLDPTTAALQSRLAKMVPAGYEVARDAAKHQVAKELSQQGYVMPPSQLDAGPVMRSLEGFGGAERTAGLAQRINQPVSKKLATETLGWPARTPITLETLQRAAAHDATVGYRPIENLASPIGIGSTFRHELRNIASNYGGSGSFPQTRDNPVVQLVNRYLFEDAGQTRLNRSFTGEDAVRQIRHLREAASGSFKQGDVQMARAQRDIATAIENQIDLYLSRTGHTEAVSAFRETRTALAKNYAIRDMLTDPFTGGINPGKAAAAASSGSPLTNGLREIAKAGSPDFLEATKPPVKANLPINYGDAGFVGGGIAANAIGGAAGLGGMGPVGLALGALPFARAGARHLVLSDAAQRMMLNKALKANGASPLMQRQVPALVNQLFQTDEP